jgi:flagellin-like hook-associated protein FlgL
MKIADFAYQRTNFDLMAVINSNIKASFAHFSLKTNERASAAAMSQLSTGKRINSAKDDAAGMAIAAKMTHQILGIGQSVRNAGDAISMLQTAEGATNEITVMLQRMSELAVQASNSTYSSEQRAYLNLEFQQLKSEINRISETLDWNGVKLLDGKMKSLDEKLTGPKPLPAIKWSHGSSTATETAEVAFTPLKAGESVTVSGLKYIATGYNSAADVALAFSNVQANAKADEMTGFEKSKGRFEGKVNGFHSSAFKPMPRLDYRQTNDYLEFYEAGKFGEKLKLIEDKSINLANGAMSILNGNLYMGDGSKAKLIGVLDPAINGDNGVIRFNFVKNFDNFNFDKGQAGGVVIDSWTTVNTRIKLDGSSLLGGQPTPTDPTSANGGLEASGVGYQSYTTKLSNVTPSGSGLSVQMSSSVDGVVNTPNPGTGGVVHGPAIISNSSVELNSGDVINFDWKASGGADAYDVMAYILNTNTGQTEIMLNTTGVKPGMPGFETAWTTNAYTVQKSGNYKFAFVSGTWDATAGFLAGANLYVDNIDVKVNSQLTFSANQIEKIKSNLLTTDIGNLREGRVYFESDIGNQNVTDLNVVVNYVEDNSLSLNFRVGLKEDQMISISIQSFNNKDGLLASITNQQSNISILSVEMANDVMRKVSDAINGIALVRSNMGATMNRLLHAIDNLTTVNVNSEQSRSQIEDADYAKASTELAKNQIKLQANTAVLAQANLSSEMILKLLNAD